MSNCNRTYGNGTLDRRNYNNSMANKLSLNGLYSHPEGYLNNVTALAYLESYCDTANDTNITHSPALSQVSNVLLQ